MYRLIIKTISIFTLCLVFSINSFAAISVSDGSAFVTKAEFSADLNNISNRMAQLENSLDSKIDSLVSTYLKRNGIWNGKKQTIKKNDIVDFWSANSLTTAMGAHWDYKTSFSNGTISEGVEYIYRNNTYDFIQACDKSGMLVGKVDIITGYDMAKSMTTSATGTDGRNFTYFISGENRDNPAVTNGCIIKFQIGGVDKSSCVHMTVGFEKAVGNLGQGNQHSLYFMPATQIFNPVFFVSKDDKVQVQYKVAITGQTNDANLAWSSLSSIPVGSYPGVAAIFGDFYIY